MGGSGGTVRFDGGAAGVGGIVVVDGGAAGAGGTRLDAAPVDAGQPVVDAGCPAGDEKLTITAAMLSASSSYSSYVPMTAFDGDMSQNSGWTASGGEQKGWLAVDFGTARQVSRVRVFPDRYISTDPSYSYLDRFRVDVWGSAGWVAATALVSTPEEKWYEVSVNASSQKLRIWAESDGNSPQIKEIEIYAACNAAPIGIDAAVSTDAAGPADVAQPVLDAACVAADEKMAVTADMLSASSSYSSYVPITCFDGDMSQNSGWCASGGEQKAWLAIDFGTAQQVSRVRVFPDRYISTDPSYSYLDRFRVDIWVGTGWVAASDLISTPEEKWYEVNVNASTQKLRIWAESDGNGPQIKEIEIYRSACVGPDRG